MQHLSTIAILTTALFVSACDSGSSVVSELDTPVLESGQLLARAGETIDDVIVTDTTVPSDAMISVSPSLPAGLSLNSLTATISGTPESASANQEYTISNNNVVLDTFSIAVGAELPSDISDLDERFSAEELVTSAAFPVKMALAEDGRIFYIELLSGNVRIIDPTQGLLPTPFATVDVTAGTERGLVGLALDPDFTTNGYVYLHATVPANGTGDNAVEHAEVIRLTDGNNIGGNAITIVDGLPSANHNGGELVFDQDGNLFVGRGDIGTAALAQTDGSLAGRVLRYTSNGGIPADNPIPGDPEWARGLRNTFSMTLHPETGGLFGGDSGALANDRVNYLEAGKNFGWGLATGETVLADDIGLNVLTWEDTITPTGLMFHTGTGEPEFANNLFYASYSTKSVARLILSGNDFTNYVSESEFMSFDIGGENNEPMHMIETDDGGLYVATLSTIYHIYPTVLQP